MMKHLIRLQDFSRKNVTAVALVLIAVIAIYNWFVTPHSNYLMAAEKYTDAAKAMEKTGRIIESELKLKQKKLDEFAGQFDSAKQAYFDVETAKTFLAGIQSQAEKNKCLVDTLKFSPARQVITADTNDIDIKEYQVNLGVVGQYADIVMLLDALQNRKQKVWLDNIKLKLKDPSTGYLECQAVMSLYTLKVTENINDVNTQK
ncbi:MAG: hypothetical protein WC765_11170 [Phycisphaerae bacterium]|jgi:Tfp pilus assembly protein PilO